VEWLSPQCKWEENQVGGFPGLDRIYLGREGFHQWIDDTRDAWTLLESRIEEIVEVETAAGTTFVVHTRLSGRGRQDIEVDWLLFNVLWTDRAGALVRRRVYFDRAEALEQAALTASEIETS
jgi:hypothetical protein